MINFQLKNKQQITLQSVRANIKKQIRKQQINIIQQNMRNKAILNEIKQRSYNNPSYISHYFPPGQNIVLSNYQYNLLQLLYQNKLLTGHNLPAIQQIQQLPLTRQQIVPARNPPQIKNQIVENVRQNVYFQTPKYRVYRKVIGKGTFSEVFQGLDLFNNTRIAAKCVKKLQMTQIDCLLKQNSQHIVKILDLLTYQNKSFIILEYCEKNLREQLDECNFQTKQVLKYFEHIMSGMNELQSRNILHRDLKFQNILVSNKIAKLADFGLAKFLGDELEVQSRRCGTPYTMPPEVFFSQHSRTPYTSKCDIWSLGVILHEMLYQRHPFNKSQQDFYHQKRVKVEKKYKYLDDIIDGCLKFDPYCRLDWRQIVQLYTKYQTIKNRLLLIDVLPINAESIIDKLPDQTCSQKEENQERVIEQYQNNIRPHVNNYVNDNPKPASHARIIKRMQVEEIKLIHEKESINFNNVPVTPVRVIDKMYVEQEDNIMTKKCKLEAKFYRNIPQPQPEIIYRKVQTKKKHNFNLNDPQLHPKRNLFSARKPVKEPIIQHKIQNIQQKNLPNSQQIIRPESTRKPNFGVPKQDPVSKSKLVFEMVVILVILTVSGFYILLQ